MYDMTIQTDEADCRDDDYCLVISGTDTPTCKIACIFYSGDVPLVVNYCQSLDYCVSVDGECKIDCGDLVQNQCNTVEECEYDDSTNQCVAAASASSTSTTSTGNQPASTTSTTVSAEPPEKEFYNSYECSDSVCPPTDSDAIGVAITATVVAAVVGISASVAAASGTGPLAAFFGV
jgi:hypothetical protein